MDNIPHSKTSDVSAIFHIMNQCLARLMFSQLIRSSYAIITLNNTWLQILKVLAGFTRIHTF